jgi:hypothetical protein
MSSTREAIAILSADEFESLPRPSPLAPDATLSERTVIRLVRPSPSALSYSVRPLPAETVSRVVRRLQQLINLPANWDDQGAVTPDVRTAVSAAAIVAYCMAAGAPLPDLEATTTGAVHAEWFLDGNIVELEVASPSDATLYYRLENGPSWEGNFWSIRSRLEQIFTRFH